MNRFLRTSAVLTAILLQACAAEQIRRPLPPETDAQPASPFASPLPGFTVLSGFGPRGSSFHTGIDIRNHRGGGDPVLASREGIVSRAETRSGYGRLVEIAHPDGFSTRYAHLASIEVKKGDRVKAGQEIGKVGATGRATTEHLHFEILTPAYRFMDPAPFIVKDKPKK